MAVNNDNTATSVQISFARPEEDNAKVRNCPPSCLQQCTRLITVAAAQPMPAARAALRPVLVVATSCQPVHPCPTAASFICLRKGVVCLPTLPTLMLTQDIRPHPCRSISTWQKYTVQLKQYFPGNQELATCDAEFDMPLTTAGNAVRPRLATSAHSNLCLWPHTCEQPAF